MLHSADPTAYVAIFRDLRFYHRESSKQFRMPHRQRNTCRKSPAATGCQFPAFSTGRTLWPLRFARLPLTRLHSARAFGTVARSLFVHCKASNAVTGERLTNLQKVTCFLADGKGCNTVGACFQDGLSGGAYRLLMTGYARATSKLHRRMQRMRRGLRTLRHCMPAGERNQAPCAMHQSGSGMRHPLSSRGQLYGVRL
jgi:hypothetical protein